MICLRLCLCAAAALGACGDEPEGKRLGATCTRDEECSSDLCVEATCLDPDGDDDGDTLVNRLEASLGTSPTHVDSDGDAQDDRAELGAALEPLDGDGDGAIDALESATADADGDCLADQVDPANTVVDPSGCVAPREALEDCEAYRAAGRDDDPAYIDPDGAGGAEPFDVVCDQTTERGGWTPLVPAYVPHTARASHEYLFVLGGRWIRSPETAGAWSWSSAREATGQWPWAAGNGNGGALDCDGSAPTTGVGLGCADAEASIRVEAVGDEASGTARVCQLGITPFPADCTDGVKVFARRVRCARDAGSALGDGDLGALADGACWSPPDVEGATLTVDASDAPPGLDRALHVTPSGGTWTLDLSQPGVTLVPAHAYRLAAWLRGEGVEKAELLVDGEAALVFGDDAQLDATWRRFERGFVAPRLDARARVSLVLRGVDAAHVAGLALDDLGPDPCAPAPGALTADPGFDHGLTCWRVEDTPPLATFTTLSDAEAPRAGGAAPVVTIDHLRGSGTPPYLVQSQLVLAADRWYRLEGWFRASHATDVLMLAGSPDLGSQAELRATIDAGAWTPVQHDFLSPVGAPTSGVWFEVHARPAPVAGGRVALDDLALRDMGANPCVASLAGPVRDGAFRAGVMCWETVMLGETAPFSADASEVPPDGQGPSLRIEPTAGATATGDVRLVQRHLSLVEGVHEITFATRMATPSSFIVFVQDAAGQVRYLNQISNVTAQWQTKAYTFSVPADDDDATLEIHLGLTSNTTWLDDIVIGPAPR